MIAKKLFGVLMALVGGFLGLAGAFGLEKTLLQAKNDSNFAIGGIVSATISALLMGALCFFLVRTGMKWIKDHEAVAKPNRALKVTGVFFVVVGGLVGLGVLAGAWENLVRFKADPQFAAILVGFLFMTGLFEVVCIFFIRVGLRWIKQS